MPQVRILRQHLVQDFGDSSATWRRLPLNEFVATAIADLGCLLWMPQRYWRIAGAAGKPAGEAGGRPRGRYSIRVNEQWRICFRWTDAGPEDVEITDYH
jgi:hypothetical protein